MINVLINDKCLDKLVSDQVVWDDLVDGAERASLAKARTERTEKGKKINVEWDRDKFGFPI